MPEGSGLSPNKYDLINEWNGKDAKSKQYEKHGLYVLSKPQFRVYNWYFFTLLISIDYNETIKNY